MRSFIHCLSMLGFVIPFLGGWLCVAHGMIYLWAWQTSCSIRRLCGALPFQRNGREESQLMCIRRTKIEFDGGIWENIDESVKQLIRRLLQMDPAARVTAKELLDDPWVCGRGSQAGGSLTGTMTVIEMMRLAAAEQQAEDALAKSLEAPASPNVTGRVSPMMDFNSISDRLSKVHMCACACHAHALSLVCLYFVARVAFVVLGCLRIVQCISNRLKYLAIRKVCNVFLLHRAKSLPSSL